MKNRPKINFAYTCHLFIVVTFTAFLWFISRTPHDEGEGWLMVVLYIGLVPPAFLLMAIAAVVSAVLALMTLEEWPLLVLSFLIFLITGILIWGRPDVIGRDVMRGLFSLYGVLTILFSVRQWFFPRTEAKKI